MHCDKCILLDNAENMCFMHLKYIFGIFLYLFKLKKLGIMKM